MPRKTAKPTIPKKQTKAAFVRSLPRTMSAKDVIAKGKAAGMSLSAAHVYAIRSGSKKSRKSSKSRGAINGERPVAHLRGSNHGAEDLLRAVASELGLSNAMAVLAAEHHRVQRLISR